MSKSQRRTSAPQRTTLPLKNSVRSTAAALDHSTSFALTWAQSWLVKAGAPKVPGGGVVRRALVMYAEHLSTCPEPAEEVRAVSRSCNGMRYSPEAQQGASERLGAVQKGQPLPGYMDLLRDPQSLTCAELDRLVDARLLSMGRRSKA